MQQKQWQKINRKKINRIIHYKTDLILDLSRAIGAKRDRESASAYYRRLENFSIRQRPARRQAPVFPISQNNNFIFTIFSNLLLHSRQTNPQETRSYLCLLLLLHGFAL